MFDGLQAIEEGLQPGDRVVVNGLQRIPAGLEVKPDEVDMATHAAAKRKASDQSRVGPGVHAGKTAEVEGRDG